VSAEVSPDSRPFARRPGNTRAAIGEVGDAVTVTIRRRYGTQVVVVAVHGCQLEPTKPSPAFHGVQIFVTDRAVRVHRVQLDVGAHVRRVLAGQVAVPVNRMRWPSGDQLAVRSERSNSPPDVEPTFVSGLSGDAGTVKRSEFVHWPVCPSGWQFPPSDPSSMTIRTRSWVGCHSAPPGNGSPVVVGWLPRRLVSA
jgi:hypothetical protein